MLPNFGTLVDFSTSHCSVVVWLGIDGDLHTMNAQGQIHQKYPGMGQTPAYGKNDLQNATLFYHPWHIFLLLLTTKV